MKSTTKLVAVAITAVALFFGTNVKAQTTEKSAWRLGIGVEGGIPTGSIFNKSHGFMLGGTARLQYGIADNLGLTLTSGYYNFFAKEEDGFKAPNLGIIPVKAGVKAFFTDNLYAGAEVGAGFGTGSGLNGTNTKLILAPALGWADQSWDVGVKYENFSGEGHSFGVVGLRVAYGFAL
ncbi:MAG: hypothetical protein EOP47_28150 [Sphingobacteriaceae bacterium]|nr:MAG: hypothetical protein EOP47_28150 [Sphingobacteriaceae bacterium]